VSDQVEAAMNERQCEICGSTIHEPSARYCSLPCRREGSKRTRYANRARAESITDRYLAVRSQTDQAFYFWKRLTEQGMTRAEAVELTKAWLASRSGKE